MKLAMTARSCPVCGSSDESRVFAPQRLDERLLDGFAFASRKFPEFMHLRLIECPACDVVYGSPAIDAGVLAESYHQASFDSATEARAAARTYGAFLPAIRRDLGEARGALDIGTGEGSFLRELLDAGFTDVGGIEPSPAAIAAAEPGVRPLIRQAMFDGRDVADGSLSLVTCFQTMEHVRQPLELVREIHRVLRPGGAVFLIDHDRRAWSARLLGTRSPIFDLEHLQLFSPASLTALLQRSGFERVRIEVVRNRYPLFYWVKLLPLPLALKRPLVALLRTGPLARLHVAIPAGNIAAIGFKPATG